jgi:hypothetical protein
MSVAIAIAAATLLDSLYMLFRRFDIDYEEGCELPHRWVAWGTCRSLAPGHDFRYFVLRLPSYQWVHQFNYDRMGWGQLTLLRFAGKWRAGYWSCR